MRVYPKRSRETEGKTKVKQMLRTLHGRLSAVLLGALCLTVLLYVPLTLLATQRYLQETNQKLNRTLATHIAENLGSQNMLKKDARSRAQAMAEIRRLMVINPNIEVYLLDREGDILAYSAAPGRVQRERVDVKPLQRFETAANAAPLFGDDPRHPEQRKVFSVSSIPVLNHRGAGQIVGYVYIILDGEEYGSVAHLVQRSYILRLTLALMGGCLVFLLVAACILFRSLTRPLRRLTAAMENFQAPIAAEHADHNAAAICPAAGTGDEIVRLDMVFRQLAARIKYQVQRLNQADKHRRELISNVSHDLRTPLAALQGYLETLLMKEGQMSAAEQRRYLTIASRHSERLNQLVSNLFELANLDAYETKIHPEAFALGELAQDTMLQFQLIAENKKVHLQTDFAPDLPFAYADIGLIQRVLENLIDNAIRYTPQGGAVTISLILMEQHIAVRVRDTGCGIPEEAIPHLFERYYRGEKTSAVSGASADGAGLGLAIVRRILQLHDSNIDVSSQVGKGAAFTFSLPIASLQAK